MGWAAGFVSGWIPLVNNGPLQGGKPSFVTVPRERVLTEVVFGESAFYLFKRAIDFFPM